MDQLSNSLRKTLTLPSTAQTLLKYLHEYFTNSQPVSENTTYKQLDKLAYILTKECPHLLILPNIIQRLKTLIHEGISERQDAPSRKGAGTASGNSLKNLLENLSVDSAQQANDAENDSRWVKKVTVQQISNLIDEVKEAEDTIQTQIQKHIKSNSKITIFEPYPELLQAVQNIKCSVLNVIKTSSRIDTSSPALSTESVKITDIRNSARLLRESTFVLLPCEAVLQNGGIIVKSGGLLLAVAAKKLSVTVIALAPSYALSRKLSLDNKSLSFLDNPHNYFEQNPLRNFDQTVIVKKYDYVGPEYISVVISDLGQSSPGFLYKLLDEYYP